MQGYSSAFDSAGGVYNNKYNQKELQETGFYDYGWRQYMPDIGRWNGMDQLSETYSSTSPYAYVMNNPVMNFDPDGRDMEMPDWLKGMWNNSQNGYTTTWSNTGDGFSNNWGGTMGFGGSPTNFNLFSGSTMGLGNNGFNIGSNSYYGGNNDYGDNLPLIDVPGVALTGKSSGWGQQMQDTFNAFMEQFNTDNANAFAFWNSHPREVTSIAGIIEGASQITAKGLAKWNAPSNISKSRIFAETISTKLPVSAKALGTASTALKWGGRVVGAVGIANTLYQYGEGNISGTRAGVDTAMGVIGLTPWGAIPSLVYFGGMAVYEHYYNDDKPIF